MKIYESGDTIPRGVLVKFNSILVDPDTITITITKPDGTVEINDTAMAKDSTGTYHYYFNPTTPQIGVYTVLYKAVDDTFTAQLKDLFRIRSKS
ncbi:hypothetical protein M0R72_11435 [Candidatus Pacearchaeota archaeon]|jgi:hypothetical protein|nr:hypothetical protein [Candidatus Pacearchaeota archaeon]